MRPAAYRDFFYIVNNQLPEDNGVNWAILSHVLLYVNLASFLFFIASVLFTRQRIVDFLSSNQMAVPSVTGNILQTSSLDYMTICLLAGFLLIAKERLPNKKFTFAINVVNIFLIWVVQFFYIWAIVLPFSR